MDYVELHCKSNFRFQEGASHADELVEQALALGYKGLAITDRHSLAGVVRGHTAALDAGLPYFVGSELHPQMVRRSWFGRRTDSPTVTCAGCSRLVALDAKKARVCCTGMTLQSIPKD